MLKLVTSLLLLSSFSALAEVQTLEIHSVVPHSFVKFSNGQVGFTSEDYSPLTNKMVEVDLDADNKILDLRISDAKAIEVPNMLKTFEEPLTEYKPSVYTNYKVATEALLSFDKNYIEGAQCYDKAHIWSYTEYTKYGGKLMKAFLFFSDAYIARTGFKWWFHTAPYAHVRMSGVINERIMDRTFSDYPLKTKLWTDLFMSNKVECKLITKYSEYASHPGEDDCYMMKTDMFTWQPKDLEAEETGTVKKTKFIGWEIKHSFKIGFGIDV